MNRRLIEAAAGVEVQMDPIVRIKFSHTASSVLFNWKMVNVAAMKCRQRPLAIYKAQRLLVA